MLNLAERVDRACLMREVGLKCIGFIGIPKVRSIASTAYSSRTLSTFNAHWFLLLSHR